jgi:hypothetical protein
MVFLKIMRGLFKSGCPTNRWQYINVSDKSQILSFTGKRIYQDNSQPILRVFFLYNIGLLG